VETILHTKLFLFEPGDRFVSKALLVPMALAERDGAVQSPFGPFAEWLKGERPSYFKRNGQSRDEMTKVLRNEEAHFNRRLITEADAEKMLNVGMEMVSLIFEDPAQQNRVE
jgi:hypothetical protein